MGGSDASGVRVEGLESGETRGCYSFARDHGDDLEKHVVLWSSIRFGKLFASSYSLLRKPRG